MGAYRIPIHFLFCLLGLILTVRPAGAQADGVVSGVKGDRIKISLENAGRARIGDQVEIYTPDGKLAGFWLVIKAEGGAVTAAEVEADVPPRPGWRAKIYSAAAVGRPDAGSPPWPTAAPPSAASPPTEFDQIFGKPPADAFVSTRGYLLKLPDGRFQDGFDNFKRWAAAKGPGSEAMRQAYARWRSGGQGLFLGVWVEKNDVVLVQTYAMAPTGLIVTGVSPGSAADRAGLSAGDIILKADGQFLTDPKRLMEAEGPMVLEVERDSRTFNVSLKAERHEERIS
jgi:hypothetical protein